jgi:diguanylate cyclase (GGDEF)-like protein
MLSIPTLWLVFVVNFAALTLVWAYVLHSYPNFEAARYWTASAGVAALGAATALLRGVIDTPLPVVVGGGLMVFACCLGSMGIDRFYGQRAAWRLNLAVTALSIGCFALFSYFHDDMAMRIVTYSFCQSVPFVVSMRHLLSRNGGRRHPGARLTAVISVLMLAVLLTRSVAALAGVGGELTPLHFNQLQAGMVVLLVFLSMMWCFGFLLMAMDRLRSEVANLALLDDLTGVANRRLLLQRLSEQCALSQRTGEPFALLAIDLDGFKAINDSFGHGAGDECLRAFTRAAQGRLRPGDLLARVGGDEFCVLMPSTTLREGAMIARRVLEACRMEGEDSMRSISASIGVAHWNASIGTNPERLIAAADQALYIAKNEGKDRHAVYNPTPAPAPEPEPQTEAAAIEELPLLRRTA